MTDSLPGWLQVQIHDAREVLQPLFGHWPSRPIDVVYPDRTPARTSFVEPAAWPTGRPRVRLKAGDPRLRGTEGWPAVMVPHEIAHAVHFDAMPLRVRMVAEARYAAWLADRLVRGAPPEHSTAAQSSPLVAWLEAFGLLAERYWLFTRRTASRASQAASFARVAAAFVRDELSDRPSLAALDPSYVPVSLLPGPGTSAAAATEGSVYRDAFLAPGEQESLGGAVAAYLAASRDGVLSMADYRGWQGLR